MLAQGSFPTRHKPQGHQSAAKRRVRFTNLDKRHAATAKTYSFRLQPRLVLHGENHGVGPTRQSTRRTLSSGVHDLRGLNALWQILTNEDVMRDRIVRERRFNVVVVACP
jgi:hypothetical protein